MGARSVQRSRPIPPADLLPVQRAATVTYRAMRILLLPVLRTLFDIQVTGRANLPVNIAFVLIANPRIANPADHACCASA